MMDKPESAQIKKPYEKPRVDSHRVFEASLACIKIPGSPMCQFNITRVRS